MPTTDDDRKIDFSPLDPARDTARWEARIAALTERAVRARPRSVGDQLALWARPIAALAAAVALVVWGAAVALGPRPAAAAPDPAQALLEWAAADRVPAASDVFATFGGSHGR